MEKEITKYDAKQAAAEIGINHRTLQKWAAAGRIKYQLFKKGCVQMRFFDAAEVQRLKEEHQTILPVTSVPHRVQAAPTIGKRMNAPWTLFLRTPISPDCWIEVDSKGPVTRAAIDRLIDYLRLIQDVFPSEPELLMALATAVELKT